MERIEKELNFYKKRCNDLGAKVYGWVDFNGDKEFSTEEYAYVNCPDEDNISDGIAQLRWFDISGVQCTCWGRRARQNKVSPMKWAVTYCSLGISIQSLMKKNLKKLLAIAIKLMQK